MISGIHCILYVDNQDKSTAFYSAVLDRSPDLYVVGMTEFRLTSGSVLGLMPVKSIRKLLGNRLPDPETAAGIPRSEIYLYVDSPDKYFSRAILHGGLELSSPQLRNWGDVAGYVLDLDGHVIAFARMP